MNVRKKKREKMKESSKGMVETMNTYWWGKKKKDTSFSGEIHQLSPGLI